MMRSWAGPILSLIFACAAGAATESFELVGGGVLSGEVVVAKAQGLIVKKEDGSYSQTVSWTNFTPNALKQLSQNPKVKPFVEPYLEPPEEQITAKKKKPDITVKIPPRLERPEPHPGFTLFKSPLSIVLILILYAANIYAGYEVSIFRNYPAAAVCSVAAVAPIIGPVLFLCLPTRLAPTQAEHAETLAQEHLQQQYVVPHDAAQEGHAHEAPPPPPGEAHAGSALPPPTVYARGYFSFNRRFFETKMPGFLRVVPSDAEKDMLIHVKSSRGEYVATRIARLMPNELYLHVVKAGASQDVMIPYNEIAEIQIRHKDLG